MPELSTGSMPELSTGSMPELSTGSMSELPTGSMSELPTGSIGTKMNNGEKRNTINLMSYNSNQTDKFATLNKVINEKTGNRNSNIMRTAIIQQSNSAGIEANKAKLAKNIAECAQNGAELIVLQELHNSLYFCQVEDVNNFDLAETIPGPSTEFYGNLAKKHKVVLVTSLFEKRAAGLYHNTAVVFESDGSIAGTYRKMHIPDDPGFYEKFYFTPGDMGFNPIQTSLGKLGVLVCWDQWYPEAARLMALAGAEVLIYPTAIGWDMRDDENERDRQRNAWITVQRGHAVANGLPVIAVNRVGTEKDPGGQSDGVNFWGNSFIAGPQGEFLYEAPTDNEENKIVDIDLKRSEDVRRIWPFLRDRRIDEYTEITKRFRD
jgi:N-carbamoylputrescine amidase